MEREDVVPEDGAALEGELLGPGAVPATTRPPGRKPVVPLHVIPPLTTDEISMLTGDPNEMLRRRAADYLTWAHNLVSACMHGKYIRRRVRWPRGRTRTRGCGRAS